MALPKQIRDQVAEAERLSAELYPKDGGEPNGEGEENPTGEGGQDQGDGALSFEGQQADEGEESGSEERNEGAPAQVTPAEHDAYEHKYKTLQGMYNSEKRRVAELTGRLEGVESMLAKMSALRETAATTPDEPAAQVPKSLLSDDEVEEYGPELIDLMKRAAREAVAGELDALRQENVQLKQVVGGVGQRQAVSDQERFTNALTVKVPTWETMNNDPGFLEWLAQPDVYAGETRQALLRKAYHANDAERVSRFFIGYLDENAALNNRGNPHPTANRGKGKVDLASMASPGAGASGSADNTNQNAGRTWKESEIGAFYEQVRKGVFKGREADYRRTEGQIQRAMNEGKILVGQ